MSRWTLCSLFLGLASASGCDIDGGYGINSSVEIRGIGDLSYAPVFVQGFTPDDLLADGTPAEDAIPLLELVTAGSMKESPALPMGYGDLGYPTELAFIAWVDVDGDTFVDAAPGSPIRYRPGPGDILAGPPARRFVGSEGTSESYTEFGDPLVFTEHRIVDGSAPPMTRLDVSTRFSMLDVPDEVELPIVFTAEAYRAGDLVDGQPCAGCSPLFVFDESIETRTGGRNELSFSSARLAEPIHVLFRAHASGQEIFHGASPLLFEGEEGRRSRAATGFALELEPN